MKKKLLIVSLAVAVMAIFCACASSNVNNTELIEGTSTESEAHENDETDAEPATEHVDSTKPYHNNEQIVTTGSYKSSNTAEDTNGEYTQITFTDEYGIDFIANVSKDTILPDEMIEGAFYEVAHSDIMTMSEPGIYPQVYSISQVGEETRTVVSTTGFFVSFDDALDSPTQSSHYTFTDESGNNFIALITEDTQKPDHMELGKSYTVNHSGIMTRSNPGIYTEVYSITENE